MLIFLFIVIFISAAFDTLRYARYAAYDYADCRDVAMPLPAAATAAAAITMLIFLLMAAAFAAAFADAAYARCATMSARYFFDACRHAAADAYFSLCLRRHTRLMPTAARCRRLRAAIALAA